MTGTEPESIQQSGDNGRVLPGLAEMSREELLAILTAPKKEGPLAGTPMAKESRWRPAKLGGKLGLKLVEPVSEQGWDDLIEEVETLGRGFDATEAEIARALITCGTERFRRLAGRLWEPGMGLREWQHRVSRKLFPFPTQAKLLARAIASPRRCEDVQRAVVAVDKILRRVETINARENDSMRITENQKKTTPGGHLPRVGAPTPGNPPLG